MVGCPTALEPTVRQYINGGWAGEASQLMAAGKKREMSI